MIRRKKAEKDRKKAGMKRAKTAKRRLSSRRYDIVSVGSSTVDVFAKTESDLISIKTPHSEEELIAYPSGSKILMTHLEFLFGGGGTNTAVSFSRLGLKTAYLGKIGLDENGRKIQAHLKNEKIDFVGAHSRDMSGYSIVLDSIEDDRTILVHKGANDKLKFRELKCNTFNTPWFYFSSMVGQSYKTMEKLAVHAEKAGARIAFNPSNYLCDKGAGFLKNIISRTHVLILNNEEAELLVGRGDVEDHLKDLHDMGPEIVVITLGKHGAVASDNKNAYVIKAPDVKVHETTGAGDAFAAGFVAGLIKKKETDIEFALRLAATNSAGCISKYGSQKGLPVWKEALKNMKKLKIRISRHKVKRV